MKKLIVSIAIGVTAIAQAGLFDIKINTRGNESNKRSKSSSWQLVDRQAVEEKAEAERKAAEAERKAAEEKAAFEKLNQFLNGEFKERCVKLLQNIDTNDQKDADSDVLSRNRRMVLRFAEKYGLSDETGILNLNSNVLKKVADFVYIEGNIRSWYTDENAKYGFVREDGTVPSWGLSPEETVKEWEVSKWIDLARKWISNAESDYDRIEQIMRKNSEAYAKEAKAAAERKAAEEKAAAERKAAEEKAAAERKEAEERAAAERKAAEEKLVAERAAFEKLLPAKITEYEKKFHFRMRTRVPDLEKKLKTFVVIKYQKQGLNDKQIAEGLRELDLQLAQMPTGADVDQQRMALRSLCDMFHPLADDDM